MIVTEEKGAADTAADVDLRTLARRATGLCGTNIERLVREARQKTSRERRSLAWSDLKGRLSASPDALVRLVWNRRAGAELSRAKSRSLCTIHELTILRLL
jgi:SpoVK/Ycf46/Vps4 family AAA+-type ATPase